MYGQQIFFLGVSINSIKLWYIHYLNRLESASIGWNRLEWGFYIVFVFSHANKNFSIFFKEKTQTQIKVKFLTNTSAALQFLESSKKKFKLFDKSGLVYNEQ